MVAAYNGNLAIIKILLQFEVDLFHQNNAGQTVFDLAKSAEIVNSLIEYSELT